MLYLCRAIGEMVCYPTRVQRCSVNAEAEWSCHRRRKVICSGKRQTVMLFGLEWFHSFTFLCNRDMPPDQKLLKSMTKKPLQNSSNQLNNLLVVLQVHGGRIKYRLRWSLLMMNKLSLICFPEYVTDRAQRWYTSACYTTFVSLNEVL